MPAQVDRSLAVELEFDKVLELIAAHARTHVGRVVIRGLADLPDDTSARVRNALLTKAVAELIEEDGVLSLAGETRRCRGSKRMLRHRRNPVTSSRC